jgi:aspartyl-tRNA(Asn)/glutamyl-tRNA(Gln) amidotransferase subunit C
MGHAYIWQITINELMKVTPDTLAHLAHLSRLTVSEADQEKMLQDLNSIVAWVDKLGEVDTNGIAPLSHMSEHADVLRGDMAKDQLSQAQALATAPKQDGAFFRVPKVVDK